MTCQRALLSLCILLLAEPRPLFAEQSAMPMDRENESRISISHAGCRGTCSIYDLTLLPSGLVLYNGVRFVKTLGKAQTHIERSKYEELLVQFERINFFSLGECALVLDAPYTVTTVAVQGKSKTVRHTYDCNGSTALADLEDQIEQTVDSRQWTEPAKNP